MSEAPREPRRPRPDELARLLCELIETRGPSGLPALRAWIEGLAAVLHAYEAAIAYARLISPEPDDLAATKRAMRLALASAFERAEKR